MFVNVYRRRVEWSECDPAKIVFYPRYFAWFDEATWRLFNDAGFTPDILETQFRFAGMPILEAKSKFHGPARFFDEVTIESHIANLQEKTFDVVHKVSNAGTFITEGVESRIWCEWRPDDPKRLKACPIPKPIADKLGS
jgi:4-hydroxybenzoyl-CoA thioesterase